MANAAPDEPVGTHSRRSVVTGHVILTLLGLVCIVPIYWMYATSLRQPGDVYSTSPFPWPLSFGNYSDAAHTIPLARLLLNTFVVAAMTAVGQLLTALLASYAFTAWRFFGQRLLFLMFVGTWLVPFQVSMLPNYVILHQWGLLNTLPGVIVPNLCSIIGVLMLRQHMRSFPTELLDAARMDGRSSWSTLWTVVVPNLRAALAALTILLFINAWNDYLWPSLVLQRAASVIQLGLGGFLGSEGIDYGGLMAAAGIASLPILVLYVILQRHIVSAFVRSGLR